MTLNRLRAPLAALAVVVLAVLAVTLPAAASAARGAAAAPASGSDPASSSLPACRYTDVKTRYQDTDKWRHTLVDTELKVTSGYVPPDLVSVGTAGLGGSGKVRSIIVDDLRDMAEAASAAGKSIAVRSAYRSYSEQAAVFQMWVNEVGYKKALLTSARPGHSEHQLGTTIDFRSGNSTEAPWDYPDWAKTPAGRWMANNAWKYGFLMSYPKGEISISCYSYEPWHYRYYGRREAAAIHASGLVPREYLWNHFETKP
jgi:zinc D-Ala-D-Ala carboxypeptidase